MITKMIDDETQVIQVLYNAVMNEHCSIKYDKIKAIKPYIESDNEVWFAVFDDNDILKFRVNSRYICAVGYVET